MRTTGARLGAVLAVAAGCLVLATSAGGSGVGAAVGPGWTFDGLQVSFDTPPGAPTNTRRRITRTFSGQVCGNALGQWRVTNVQSGGDGTFPPSTRIVDFRVENPTEVASNRFLVNGVEVARITFFLRLTAGQAPRLTPEWQVSGDIQNVVASPAQVTATAQTIAECPAAQPPPSPPPPPSTVPSGTASGTVLVNGKRYTSGRPIPYGSSVNVTDGRLTLKTEAGTLTAYGGGVSAVFKLLRLREQGRLLVELRLTGGNFKTCGSRALAAAGQAKKPVRRLWAKGSGKFRTRGRLASATVRGTWWLTEDRCDQTIIQVRQGSLLVADFVTKKKVLVKAPKSYSAGRKRG